MAKVRQNTCIYDGHETYHKFEQKVWNKTYHNGTPPAVVKGSRDHSTGI